MVRARLDTAVVVREAADLVDAEGLAALSLSAVAGRLGVKSPSLYVHVAGLDDLRRRLAIYAADELSAELTPAVAGRARGDALRALGQTYRAWVLAHPGLYASVEPNGPRGDPSIEHVLTLVLSVLRGYGLEGDTAIHAARSLRSMLHGFTVLEAGGGFGIPVDLDVSFDWMLNALDRGFTEAYSPFPDASVGSASQATN
jgi:AcrR family transcriptional regulator